MQPQHDVSKATSLVRETLVAHGFPCDLAEAYSTSVYDQAIETQPWSSGSLLTLEPNKEMPLNLGGYSIPTVTYYSPIKAAFCALHTLDAIIAENPVAFGLSVICALEALLGIRAIVSPAEALLLSIVYY